MAYKFFLVSIECCGYQNTIIRKVLPDRCKDLHFHHNQLKVVIPRLSSALVIEYAMRFVYDLFLFIYYLYIIKLFVTI